MSQNTRLHVPIVQMKESHGLDLPAYATPGSAAVDLYAAVDDPIILRAGARELVPTGLKMAIPQGYEGQVRGRSGLALKHGICVLNSPGTIDSDYRGEIKVILANSGQDDFEVTRGMRIAQMVFAACQQVQFESVLELEETQRGSGGFGSTGSGPA